MKIPLLIIAAITAATSFPLVINVIASAEVAVLTLIAALTYIALLFLLLPLQLCPQRGLLPRGPSASSSRQRGA